MASWQCTTCGTVNSVNAMRCAACDDERPPTEAAPPAPAAPAGVDLTVVDLTLPKAPAPAREPLPTPRPRPLEPEPPRSSPPVSVDPGPAPGRSAGRTAALVAAVAALCLLVGAVGFVAARSAGDGDGRRAGSSGTTDGTGPAEDGRDETTTTTTEPEAQMPTTGTMTVAGGADTMSGGRPMLVRGRPVQVTYEPSDPEVVTSADLLLDGEVVASGSGGTVEWASPVLPTLTPASAVHRLEVRLGLADGSVLEVGATDVSVGVAPGPVVEVIDRFTTALADDDWATAAAISTDPVSTDAYITGYATHPHDAQRIVMTPLAVADLGGGTWEVRGVDIAEEVTHTRGFCVTWQVDTVGGRVRQTDDTRALVGPGPDEAWKPTLMRVEDVLAEAAAACGG